MSTSEIIDLCSDDEMGESGMENCRREAEPGFESAPPDSACPTPICKQFWKAGDYEVGKGKGHQAANQYGINRMHIHPKFLHSNATSHKWAFGAMAELLDNAVDEIQNGATFVSIDKMSIPRHGNTALVIQDDGGGMDPEALRRCISFGFSDKKSEFTIGQYGNGFKTSSMRLGADVIVFSRHLASRRLTQSVGLLSYTFLARMGYNKIVVPVVDYEFDSSARTFGPIILHDKDHFSSNLTMLLQWSPYSTEEELLKQFDDIGDHGTKIVVYNLWLNDDEDMELDFNSDPEDICINGVKELGTLKRHVQHVANLYQHSLRAYASVLYRQLPQYFRIILRGQDVERRNVAFYLNFVEFIKYRPKTEGTIKYRPTTDGNLELEYITAIGFWKEAARANIHGFNIYHRNRLILPFWRVLKQMTGSTGRGVVGVLEPNFIQPTHNKQDFEKTSLFHKLEDRLKQMTVEYWKKYSKVAGYQTVKKVRSKRLRRPKSPSSRTRNSLHLALLLNHGSHEASSGAAGSLEDPQVAISDASSSGLQITADISSEGNVKKRKDLDTPLYTGNVKKRKDLDTPLEPQLAKRHTGHDGTDVQYITKQSKNSIENTKQISQKIILIRENRRLRSEMLATEKRIEELSLKMQQLMRELEDEQRRGGELENELTQFFIQSYA
ncbi:hypothetical protein FF1_023409 [Malus domestica]